MRRDIIRWTAAAAAAVFCIVGTRSTFATVKVIGDFEGTMASPYTVADPIPATVNGGCAQPAGTVNWCTDGGISVPPKLIDRNNVNDQLYWGAVTRGQGALLFTFPGEWGSVQAPYLRLHGQQQLLADMSSTGFHFMAFDVTTFGGYQQPPNPVPANQGPYRQVFTVINSDVGGFYGKTESGDDDIQVNFPMATFDQPSFTTTVMQDLTGPLPPANAFDSNDDPDDGKIAVNALAGFENPNNESLAWQIVLVFQGRDYPPPSTTVYQIKVGIDNFRLCNTAAECLAAPGVPGDYNGNGVVDGADYVLWRKGGPLKNEVADPNIISAADYTEWRARFGNTAAPAAGVGSSGVVPEPSTLLLIATGLVCFCVRRRAGS